MAQEEVTRQAPKFEDVLGSPETQALGNASGGNIDIRLAAEQIAKDAGISRELSRGNINTVTSRENPYAETGIEESYKHEDKVYEQSALADFAAGLYNGLVIDTGEGLANLIPTVAQALGSEAEFLDIWSTNVSEFFENQRAIYSDEAYNTIDEFGDINGSHIATALGQGVGFLVGIIGGAGLASNISKGAKILSRVGKTSEGLIAAVEAAKVSGDAGRAVKAIKTAESFAGKTKNIIAAAQKGQQRASRVGSFLAGTVAMYPSIHKEAIEAGLDKGAAARFALGVSGLVSMTEGAALEWIGKVATKPLTSAIATKTSRDVLLNAADGNPTSLMKMFVPKYVNALKGKMGVITEGAAIEFGQESVQTYIEEGAKQLYDTVYKGQDKGYFGADITTKKTFVEAIFGGAIGAVLGGVMAGGHRPEALGDELNQEGMFGYINNAVAQNKLDKIDKVKSAITDLVSSGKMTDKQAQRAIGVVDSLTAFAKKVKPTHIKDDVAKYQLYQLDTLGNKVASISEGFEEKANDKNPKIAADYKNKQGMLGTIQKSIQAEFDAIYDTGQKQTSNKLAFDSKLDMYQTLINDLAKNGVTEKEFKLRMEAITSLNDSVHAAKGTKENTVSIDGIDFDVDVIDKNMDALLDLSEQLERGKITKDQYEKELELKYGLTAEHGRIIADFDFKKKYDLLKVQAIKTQAAQTQQATQTGNKTSTTKTPNEDIEAKKADIERRKEEKFFKPAPEPTDDFFKPAYENGKNLVNEALAEKTGPDLLYQLIDLAYKGTPAREIAKVLGYKEQEIKNIRLYLGIPNAGTSKTASGAIISEPEDIKAFEDWKNKIDKINAELAALEATQSGNKTTTSEKKQGKVKMKVYRTEGTGMGKLSQAHRGSGKYYGLDKFFSTGKKGETFSEVELEIDEDTTLDLTESQKTGKETKASVKYKEITDEARKRLEALPKNEVTTDTYNDLVRDVALEKGITGVISYIEPGAPDIATMMNIGREYVDYSKPAKSKETNGTTTEQSLENLTTDELKAKSQEIKDELKKIGNTANINDVSRMIDQYKAIDKIVARKESEKARQDKKESRPVISSSKQFEKKSKSIGSIEGKKVEWQGKQYTVVKEGVKYVLESSNDIVELPGDKNTTVNELSITVLEEDKPKQKAKKEKNKTPKRVLSNATELGIMVNGRQYVYVTDSNGNITSLVPVDKNSKRITNEAILIEAEIQRNKLEYSSLTEEEISDETIETILVENPELKRVDSIIAENLTDSIDSSIDKLYKGEVLTELEALSLDLYLDQGLDAAMKAYLDSPTSEMNELYETFETIKRLLYEQTKERISEETTSVNQQANEQVEPTGKTEEELKVEYDDKVVLMRRQERIKKGIVDNITEDTFSDMTDSQIETLTSFVNGETIDPLKAQYLADYLYVKYKELSALRNKSERLYTSEEIDAFKEQLENDLTDLSAITDSESSFLQSTRVKREDYGKPKKKTGSEKKRDKRESNRLKKKKRRAEAVRIKEEKEVTRFNKPVEKAEEYDAEEANLEATDAKADIKFSEKEELEIAKFKKDINTKQIEFSEIFKKEKDKITLMLWEALKPYMRNGAKIYYQDGYYFAGSSELAAEHGYAGTIDGKGNVLIFDKTKLDPDTILHELLHDFLFDAININKDEVLISELQRIFDKVKKDTDLVERYSYAFNNLDEFVSEVFGNRGFRQELSYIKDFKLSRTSSVFDSISKAIKDFLNREFGFEINNTVLDNIFNAVEHTIKEKNKTSEQFEKDSSIFEKSEISEDESGIEEYPKHEIESSSLDEVSRELDGYEDDGGIGEEEFESDTQSSTSVKAGVQELFDSNPELANQVYEALGLKSGKTIPKKGDTVTLEFYFEKEDKTIPVKTKILSIDDATTTSNQNGVTTRPFGESYALKLESISNGKEYEVIVEEDGTISLFWDKSGKKPKIGTDNYISEFDFSQSQITPQQKQQALQVYSQYLDTVLPNSEVKYLVYILNNEEYIEGFKNFVTQLFTGTKEGGLDLKSDKENNDQPVFQATRFAEVTASNQTIKDNPTLFNNIRNFFKAAFPNVSVEIVDSMMEKYGFDALASAYNNMINIQKDSALQSSIIHEYAEIYVESLGLDHPLVKMGMELVRGTEMHKRAIEAYPNESAEVQLKEALMETIALKGLAQLKTKFEGTTTQKIMEWLKRFWNRIAGMFNSKKYNELDKLTKGLLKGRTTYKTNPLLGVRFQKNYSSVQAAAGMYIQNTISRLRLEAISGVTRRYKTKEDSVKEGVSGIDVNNPVLLRREIYRALLQRYKTEKNPDKTTAEKIFENINLENENDLTEFFNKIQEKEEWLKNFINESIKSVTRVSKVTDRDLAENEGIIKADSSNAIKANKGFSPSVRSVISSIVDNEGKAMPINEIYRYVASIAAKSLNPQDFFRRVKEMSAKNPNNLIYDRIYNLLKYADKKDRQMLLYEMSNVRQNIAKKFGLSKEVDKVTGTTKNKAYVKQLNKDYETSTTAESYKANIKRFNDITALEDIFEATPSERNWYQNFNIQSITNSTSEFSKRLSAVKVSDITRQQYNQILSLLIGDSIPIDYTNSLIDSGISKAQGVLYRIATNTPNYKFGSGKVQQPIEIGSTLGKIAEAIEGTESVLNSYVNSNGENVTSTSVTHWMDDLARMYESADPKRLEKAQKELRALQENGSISKEDIDDLKKVIAQLKKAIKYKDNYKKSKLYKNNTILKLADKNQGKINYFNADAIDNDGKVRELDTQSKNDIVLTQLMGFANDPSKNTYSQQYGVQGDRPKTMFFDAPRLRGADLDKAYNDIIEADEFLYEQHKKELKEKLKDTKKVEEALAKYRNIYNKSGLTKINAEGKVQLPSQEDIDKRVKAIKRIVEASGLGETALRDDNGELTGEVTRSVFAVDHVYGENPIYNSEDEMYENFVRNESINRTHLNNLFQGPAVQRKSVEDHIKRALGTNSTAMLTNIDKPVVTVVIRAKSKTVFDKKGNPINTSDSMSINGSRLYNHLANEVGGEERLGSNMKDLLFQVDPLTGKMLFLKMSSINIVGKPGDNNLTKMTNPKNNTGRTGYAEIAEVAFQLEELIGDNKYLKIVDEKAIKGNEGADVVALDIDELMAIQREQDPAKKAALLQSIIDNNSFTAEYNGYRIPFKMHKDLSKVALKDQKAVVSTQATKIALNTGHTSDLIKFEKALVDLLRKNLGLKKGEGYKTSSIYKKFKNTSNIINGVLTGSEESGKESVVHLLDGIKQYNESLDAETKDMRTKLTALTENNKDVTKRSDEVVKEIKSLESKINAINSKKITALDHPNIKGMVEQYIGSAMTTTAARAEMSGNYLHMVPNYSNDLKAPTKISVTMTENQKINHKAKIKKNEEKLKKIKDNPNSTEEAIAKQENYLAKLKAEYASGVKEKFTDFEVAVPWSMFGSSLEEAQAFLNKRKAKNKPVKVVVVRVPASDAVSTFAADVAYFIDGQSNMAIVPDQFVKMSDADHDGDKVFVYREELTTDKEGKTLEVDSAESKLFWRMYKQISSDEITERHNNDLSTTEIEEILDKHGLRNAEGYSLEGNDDVADVLSKYSFGAKAIGIEAVAGKLLSMFTQSDVALKSSITYKGVTYKAFVTDNQIAVAKILQAALDMGNDPILLETGINKYTIGAANVMLYLGVSLEDTILMMRNPAIQNFIKEVDADQSVFSKYSGKFEDTLSREADKLSGITKVSLTMSQARAWSKGVGLQKVGKFEVGGIYGTKGKDSGYFRVGKDAETGKLIIVDENVGPSNTPEVSLIRSFLEFHEAAQEIKSIIPVIQMDNAMPKNSEDLRKALEAFEKLRTGNVVDFSPLLNRPLLQHYESVLDLMVDLEETHFATEKGSYGANGKNNMINEIERAFKKDYSNRNKIVDTFTRMVAQGESPVDNPAKFESAFVNKLTMMLEYINEGGLVHATPEYNELLSHHSSGNIEEYNNLMEWLESALDENQKSKFRSDVKEWIDLNNGILNSIKDPNNMFLKAITIHTNKQGVSSVIPQKGYRQQGEHIKEQIRQDFLKIMDTPLGQAFINYQMLKNGVADKIGSLIDMMPREISVNYLRKMSKIKDSGNIQPNFKQAYKLNALMYHKSDLPKGMISNYGTWLNQGWARDKNDNVIYAYKGTSSTLGVEHIRAPRYYNENKITKFDPSATISKESYEKLESCKIKF